METPEEKGWRAEVTEMNSMHLFHSDSSDSPEPCTEHVEVSECFSVFTRSLGYLSLI